jgi:hypothetical protein
MTNRRAKAKVAEYVRGSLSRLSTSIVESRVELIAETFPRVSCWCEGGCGDFQSLGDLTGILEEASPAE